MLELNVGSGAGRFCQTVREKAFDGTSSELGHEISCRCYWIDLCVHGLYRRKNGNNSAADDESGGDH